MYEELILYRNYVFTLELTIYIIPDIHKRVYNYVIVQ